MRTKSALWAILASLPFAVALIFAQDAPETSDPPPSGPSEEVLACMSCHDPEAQAGPAVNYTALSNSPHKDFDCTSCHPSYTADAPHTEEMLAEKADCASCHPDVSEEFMASVHAKPSVKAGDHPTCATCHGGGDPHAVKIVGQWSRQAKVEVCSSCHRDSARMQDYGKNVEAVASYDHSFHGKALLKFGNLDTAICMDCHGHHGVFAHTDPRSTVHQDNLTKTCSQAGCHVGAGQNFAVSGASHMDITISREPLLGAILVFFRVLVFSMAAFLMIGVGLDLRRAIIGPEPPRCGRSVAFILGLGFLAIVAAIFQATLNLPGPLISSGIGVGLLILAVMIFKIEQRGKKPEPEAGRKFLRLTVFQRIQHAVMAISFGLLVLTGMPVRQSESDFLRNLYMAIGGLEVGRWIHRVAGVAMILVFTVHVAHLLWKWKNAGFKFSSWTMWPNKKDVLDFIQLTKYYLGKTEEEPKYGRYSFRSKLDYLAEYWGIPLMGLTGLILWFPVFFGGFLPSVAIPAAYIAHSYEAVLAFLAILTWHMYNTNLNPHNFPMTRLWLTGTLTEEEMRREHPLELEAILESEKKAT